jgi:hypothetical protein
MIGTHTGSRGFDVECALVPPPVLLRAPAQRDEAAEHRRRAEEDGIAGTAWCRRESADWIWVALGGNGGVAYYLKRRVEGMVLRNGAVDDGGAAIVATAGSSLVWSCFV